MSVLCIIPARGGSKRVPHKNIMDFNGRPMISYSIEAAKGSGVVDELMVSTDDSDIAEVAKSFGAKIPFLRSSENSDDTVGIADVLIEVVNEYDKVGLRFDYIICVLATAPLIRAENIRRAFDMLVSENKADSICTVEAFSYPPQRGLVMKDGNLEMLHPEYYFARSQDLPRIYHDCGQFFIFRTEALLGEKKLYTKRMLPFFINERESQDIDTYEDVKIAELKYRMRKEGW